MGNQNSSIDRELTLKIRVKNHEHKVIYESFQCTLPNKNLDKIRNLLGDVNNPQCFRMKADDYFLGEKDKILYKEEESKINLEEIINDRCILNIVQSHIDWQPLIDMCDHGFIIDNENDVDKAKHRAFKINEEKIRPECKKILKCAMDKRQENHESEFEELCKRNFIAHGKLSISPWLSIFLGKSKEESHKMLEKQSTKYSYTELKKAELTIPKSCITLTDDFKNDVIKALSKGTTSDKIDELRNISKKYGHFYAHRITFGGAVIEKLTNIEVSNSRNKSNRSTLQVNANKMVDLSISQDTNNNVKHSTSSEKGLLRIRGGLESTYGNIKTDIAPWLNSLADFQTWKIIKYDDICPIFKLLDDELQEKVLIALGQRILAADVKPIICNPNEEEPSRVELHEIFRKLKSSKMINNIYDCQIFASIMNKGHRNILSLMNKEHRNIFSLHVEYIDENTPEIFINCIPVKKSQQQKISIGWIIVGYPRNFDFDNTDVILKSDKYLVSEKGTHFVAKDLGYEVTGCILCTCVIEAPEKTVSRYNPYKSRIFGTHCHTHENSACIFTPNDNDENIVVPRLKLFSSRGNSGQKNIKWEDAFTFPFGRNCSNVQLYHGTIKVGVGSKKDANGSSPKEKHSENSETPILLVNQLVEDCSTNVHGLLNVKVDKVDVDSVGVIYGSLNSKLSKKDGKIAYLVVHKTQ
ncbi:4717_t:CDS:2 [Racocetra persica]|uniref:4717_t:CDS:1 n=1 Tax=Racocetra persica TaxID=160502 RepID=A0ACA9KV29_9GLOM|nr:4717_t:CDS:2 [Racocetra persica]